MKRLIKINNQNESSIKFSFVYLFLAWTIIILGIVSWSYFQLKDDTFTLAYKEANKSYEKDLMFRFWSAMHGGVYVPITDSTQPNPYLHATDREIITPSGKRFTLMNPAYMTRQINELSRTKFHILSNITSLNPIRPANQADKWETKALKTFERGGKEYYGIDTLNGEEYFRFMAPLITTESCLKCHQDQGYKLGDIRGGLSTSIPWKKYENTFYSQIKNIIIGYGMLWLIGIIGLNLVRMKFVLYLVERKNAENLQNKLMEELSASKEEIEVSLFNRNRLVEELTETKIQLELANNAKDKFFSIIAHDLKNPLGSFRSMLELIVEEYDDFSEKERIEFLQMMKASSNQVYALLENLLEWSRSQRGMITFNPEKIDLGMLLQNSMTVLHLQADKKYIEMVNNIPHGTKVFADVNSISTVFRNLISNAIKFTENKGLIIVSIKEANDKFVTVSVKDNGIGMSEEMLSKIFNIEESKSSKGTSNETGTGLGLILCKEFIEKNGGKIWVESAEGTGTCFYFTLPK